MKDERQLELLKPINYKNACCDIVKRSVNHIQSLKMRGGIILLADFRHVIYDDDMQCTPKKASS